MTSRPRTACGSRVSGTAACVHATTTAATGTLMRNAHRQPGPSTRKPPRNGPTAPATPPSPDHAPTAGARSRARKLACRIARLPGVSSAPPTPCRTRAATSTVMFGRGATKQRRRREPDGADHEDLAASVPVAERATQQDQRGQREQIAGEHPLQRAHTGVEVLSDVRQRDVDHGRVETRHPAGADRRRERHAALAGVEREAFLRCLCDDRRHAGTLLTARGAALCGQPSSTAAATSSSSTRSSHQEICCCFARRK